MLHINRANFVKTTKNTDKSQHTTNLFTAGLRRFSGLGTMLRRILPGCTVQAQKLCLHYLGNEKRPWLQEAGALFGALQCRSAN
jgi:hypothetical protein